LEIFHGSMSESNRPAGICCFQSASEKEKIVFKIQENENISIALITEGSSIVHLTKTANKNSKIQS